MGAPSCRVCYRFTIRRNNQILMFRGCKVLSLHMPSLKLPKQLNYLFSNYQNYLISRPIQKFKINASLQRLYLEATKKNGIIFINFKYGYYPFIRIYIYISGYVKMWFIFISLFSLNYTFPDSPFFEDYIFIFIS